MSDTTNLADLPSDPHAGGGSENVVLQLKIHYLTIPRVAALTDLTYLIIMIPKIFK